MMKVRGAAVLRAFECNVWVLMGALVAGAKHSCDNKLIHL